MNKILNNFQLELLDQFECIDHIAGFFLSLFHIHPPPVPIKVMVKQLGCYSNNGDHLPRESLGVFMEDSGLIVVPENMPAVLERFTIAHEIGHWVLHGNGLEVLGVAKNSYLPKPLASLKTKEQKKRLEIEDIEANQFAAAALIPKSPLFGAALQHWIIDRLAIKELARTFDVSPIAMLLRIKNLATYSQWKGPTINWPSLSQLEQEWKQNTVNTSNGGDEIVSAVGKVLSQHYCDASLVIVKQDVGSSKKRRRRPAFAKRKVIIEVAGPPNAGKDRQIDILSKYLRTIGYKVASIEEGFEACSRAGSLADQPHSLRLQWSIGYTTQKLLNYGSDKSYDVVILNRGPFDYLALTHYWHSQGRITKREAEGQTNFLLGVIREWIDMVILLRVPPATSIDREDLERRNALKHLAQIFDDIDDFPEQRIVNREALRYLEMSYDFTLSTYKDLFKSIVEIKSRDNNQTAEKINEVVRPRLIPKRHLHKKHFDNDGSFQPHLPGLSPLVNSR